MMLCAERVSAGYGDRHILSNVSVALSAGEWLTLVGPNGAGKTTLLHVLAGLRQAHKGEVICEAKNIYDQTHIWRAQHIGVVLQEHALVFDYPVYDVVLMGRYPYQQKGYAQNRTDKEIVEKSLSRMGVLHLAKRSIHAISSGERQRVMIARALAQEPPFLLLDEPMNHLDMGSKVELCEWLWAETRQSGLGLLMIMHELSLVLEYSDKICVLQSGVKVGEGRVNEVSLHALLEYVFSPWLRVVHEDTAPCGVQSMRGQRPVVSFSRPRV